ncbi:MAG: ribosomal protein [Patescibacteria group bacterium]|jgi:small subunit ribosomal protein S16|nr:ribosomal protein [Patescibacteria group bacterium]
MLSIRLTRTGKIHAPHYRIVVQEKRSKLNGKSIDIIGHYHPAQAGKLLVIDKEKAEKWLKNGAQPSDTVTNLFVKQGILSEDQKVHHFFTPTKTEIPAAKEAPEAVVEETVAEEAVATEETAPEEVAAETEEATPEVEVATEEAPEAEVTTEEAPEAETTEKA